MAKKKKTISKDKYGIRLDVGCGINKQKGFVGIDIVPHECVDIVHDLQVFPWPVPDDSCYQILLSHVWEHIEPKYRFQLMDELWRICKADGQVMIAAPYAGSWGDAAHPAHYSCPNNHTFTFFDPDYPLYNVTSYKKPLPWKLIRNDYDMNQCVQVILEPRKNGK